MTIPIPIEEAQHTLNDQGLPPILDGHGQKYFLTAAREGNLAAVKAYLTLGMPIDIREEDTGKTALIHAVEGNHLELVRFLIAAGADLEAVNWRDETALFTAVNWQHSHALRILIDAGANTDLVSTKGFSPLSSAVEKKNTEILEILLDVGANPNWCPEEGAGAPHYVRPLYFAAINGEAEMVQILFNAGANPDARRGEDDRPFLHQIIANEEWDVARQFIAAGADLRASNRHGWTPWMMAIYMGNEAFAKKLVEAGATPSVRLSIRMVKAALAGDQQTVEACIAAGADIDFQDMDGDTALTLATVQGHADLAFWLLEQGADVNHANDEGATPLMAAAAAGNADIVQQLLVTGANVAVRDALGRSVLYWAAIDEDETTLSMLTEVEAPALDDLINILSWAFVDGTLEEGIARLVMQGIQDAAFHRHWLTVIQAGLDAAKRGNRTLIAALGLDTGQEAQRLLQDILTDYLHVYGAGS